MPRSSDWSNQFFEIKSNNRIVFIDKSIYTSKSSFCIFLQIQPLSVFCCDPSFWKTCHELKKIIQVLVFVKVSLDKQVPQVAPNSFHGSVLFFLFFLQIDNMSSSVILRLKKINVIKSGQHMTSGLWVQFISIKVVDESSNSQLKVISATKVFFAIKWSLMCD